MWHAGFRNVPRCSDELILLDFLSLGTFPRAVWGNLGLQQSVPRYWTWISGFSRHPQMSWFRKTARLTFHFETDGSSVYVQMSFVVSKIGFNILLKFSGWARVAIMVMILRLLRMRRCLQAVMIVISMMRYFTYNFASLWGRRELTMEKLGVIPGKVLRPLVTDRKLSANKRVFIP